MYSLYYNKTKKICKSFIKNKKNFIKLKVMKFLELLKLIFSKRSPNNISFQDKFLHFQQLLSANDEAHKYMSDLSELIAFGKPFSRSKSTKLYKDLYEKTEEIARQLTYLSNGKYKKLEDQVRKIGKQCEKIISPRILCLENWNCERKDCEICEKVKSIDNSIPYFYNLNEINQNHLFEVGSKMSRLGEIKNVLNLPVPDGFCLSIRLFEDIMINENLREKKNNIFYNVDFEDFYQVEKASRETQQLFISIPIPDYIERIILEAFDSTFGINSTKKVAVRSSAIGEDSEYYSFAGLHQSILNVSRDNLLDACYEVLISKYSPQSLIYRYFSGLRDEDMPMSIGCIEMINPYCAGVLFTYDIINDKDNIVINAVRGLGSLVVEGRAKPEVYIISSDSYEIISFEYGKQEQMNIAKESDGVYIQKIDNTQNRTPILTQAMLRSLIDYALIIKNHFGAPQDIEWAIDNNGKVYILQARSLLNKKSTFNISENRISIEELDNKYKPLITKGDCASKGIRNGQIFIVKSLLDMKNCPKGAILVAKKNLPEFASLIHKISGVITESGSLTGHLSIIAREIGVPVLTNVEDATKILKNNMNVTLYSDAIRAYEGFIANEIKDPIEDDIIDNPFIKSPIYRIFHKLSQYLFKLNLTNPNSENFKPENCQTLHDVIRFAHEKAMNEIFTLYDRARTDSCKSYKFIFEVPIDIYIIDLGDGLDIDYRAQTVKTENIKSKPFLALIEGMTTPGLQWAGPLSVDFKGFMNIIMANISDSHKAERDVGSRSYALISHNYVNFFSRLGYHFSRLDAFASDEENSNYINFHFRGGAADLIRRTRRAKVIQKILEEKGFAISRINDNLIARIRKTNEETTYNLLTLIGKLIGAVRNTDVTLLTDEHINIFVKAFLEGDPAPAKRFIKNTL